MTAPERLQHHAETAYPYRVFQAGDRIRCVVGLGHSNSIAIEGDTSLILIDSLDSDQRGERLKSLLAEWTSKPVKTIIYTHGHPDHRGGSGAFRATAEEIIMSSPRKPALKYYDRLNDVLQKRTVRQFGYSLTDEECITQGIGIREGHAVGDGRYDFLPPTTLFTAQEEERVIDGVRLKLVSAPGETDDQLFVWLPEENVLCCGDNYYGCWPNLYAIRGSQYRDIAQWVKSLDVIRAYPAEVLLPGHTAAIIGQAQIQKVLGNYRDAIAWILETTLEGMNAGKTIDELAATIRLPEKYATLPYLGEHYGCTEWTVRAIYTAYLGWFDGNATNLHPLAPAQHAKKMIALAGGAEKVRAACQQALAEGDYQWCLELCDLLLNMAEDPAVLRVKAAAMDALAGSETSANGRHYYQVCAQEIRDRLNA